MAGKPYNVRSSLNIISRLSKRMSRAGDAAHVAEVRNAYKILVGKTQRKRLLESSGLGGTHNIAMHLR